MLDKLIRFPAVLAALALAAHTAAAADSVKLKLATFGTAANPIVRCGPMSLEREITKRSGGKITFENFVGASGFAAPRKLYEEVAKNIVNLSWGLQAYSPGRFPLTEVISLPFAAEDNIAAARAVAKLFPKYLAKEYRDVHVIMLPMVSPYQLHSRKPVKTIADLKGLRIRAAGRGVKESLEMLGAAVASMPATLQYENLEKGVIDASMGTWASLIAFKLNEIVKYHLALNYATLPAFMIMSKKSYAALTKAQQAIIDSLSTPEKAAEISSCWNKVDAHAIAQAKKLGHTIYRPSAAELDAWRKATKPAVDKVLAEIEAKGHPARAFYNALEAEMKAGARRTNSRNAGAIARCRASKPACSASRPCSFSSCCGCRSRWRWR